MTEKRRQTILKMKTLIGVILPALLATSVPARSATLHPLVPIAQAEMGSNTHAALSAQGVVATLDVRRTSRCNVPVVWADADTSPASPCSMAFLTLSQPGNTHSHPASFPLTPYGTEDDGMAQLKMSLRHLDASSPFPQVMVSAYTGGAHCCSLTSIFDLSPDGSSGRSWQHLELGAMDGDGEPDVVDVAGNGQQEILTSDQSFLYAFASHAGSEAPVVIARYHDGVLKNVTRDPAYRDYLTKDLADRRRNWIKSGRFEPNGFLAYEVATMANMDRFEKGWRDMLAHAQSTKESGFGLSACDLKPTSKKQNGHACSVKEKELLPFPQALSLFLVRAGYVTPEQIASVTDSHEPASMLQSAPPTATPHETPNPPSSAAAQAPERDQTLSASAVPAKSKGLFVVLGVPGLALYLVPVLIAYRRNTIRQHWIAIITVLLGWTIIGWIAALVMALNEPIRTR
ncbi:superinfection immunity protein [Gluconobacter sphaericus]|uniref:superinfection immunity protein n=1 Tax=Gluconobacter sphaericus TaxID=574987 RepID=UPI001B8BA090|nr:superinfection immunity protein [Gluconobacter sphaericus]MBS1086460.1 superinfection immunity protein [Gluconobacter sphaericus]MBS1100430.1 superinfection immunity protein [Gluconobacter sphaericus]